MSKKAVKRLKSITLHFLKEMSSTLRSETATKSQHFLHALTELEMPPALEATTFLKASSSSPAHR